MMLHVETHRAGNRWIKTNLRTIRRFAQVEHTALRRADVPTALDGGGAEMADPLAQRLERAHRHPIRIIPNCVLLVPRDLRHEQTQENVDVLVMPIAHSQTVAARYAQLGNAACLRYGEADMGLDLALVSFHGVNSAAEAFATARGRMGTAPRWTSEVGFVEHHHSGHLALRGTFAGHYVDVDEADHVSERGAAEGAGIGAVLGTILGGPLGLAVGTVAGGTLGSQVGQPSELDAEPEPLADRLRAAVPRSGSAIVLIADADDVGAMIAALGEPSAQVIRRALSQDEAAAVDAALSASPAASPGPSLEGEEAVEASEAGPA